MFCTKIACEDGDWHDEDPKVAFPKSVNIALMKSNSECCKQNSHELISTSMSWNAKPPTTRL